MITVTKTITLNNVALPVDYFFTFSDSCVNLEDTNITDNVITSTFTFLDDECIQFNSVVNLHLQDANGCKRIFQITINNPCVNFTSAGIVSGPQFSFRIPFTGGRGPFTYEWSYDTSLFELDHQVQNVIFLNPIGEFIDGQTTLIEVLVTDANGCEINSSIDYEVCGPVFDLETFQTTCRSNGERSTGLISLNITACNGAQIDWSTLDVEIPDDVQFINEGSGNVGFIFPDDFPSGTVTFPATVQTFDGVTGYGEIVINVVNCSHAPDIIQFEFNFECEACENVETREIQGIVIPDRDEEDNPNCFGPVAIYMPDLIVDGDINWNSFTFIQGAGQVLVSPFEIYTQFGHAIFVPSQEVIYEPNIGLVFDVIVYQVETNDGETLQGSLIFRSDVCAEAPIAVNDNFCVACGEVLGPINLLANDLGEIDPASFEFLGPYPSPDQGVLTIFPNGIIQFNPNVDFNGQITFNYRVYNFDGVASNVATVTIDVNCIDDTLFNFSYCLSDSPINLWDLIGSGNTSSTWTFVGYTPEQTGTYVGQFFAVNGMPIQFYLPDQQITNSYVASVDLTIAGFYTFVYSGGQCVPDVTVIIEMVDVPELEDQQFTVCTLDGAVNLDELVPGLPEGTWNFNGDGFEDPIFQLTETGVFEFHYVVDGEGTFGDICDSTFTLTLIVEAPGFNPGYKEITVCTGGIPPS